MPVRMKDIARRVGVSQATVSHVLRGKHSDFRISDGTAGRVLEMASQLGYRPSALARNFQSHRAYSLCLAVGDLTDSFWSGVATGAQAEAERHGYTLVVSNTSENEDKERHAIDLLRERRVDGIILCPTGRKAPHLKDLRTSGRPFVFVDRTIAGLDVSSVVTDNVAGMRMAVEHLARRGHRRIGYVGGPVDRSTFRDRLKGYRQAMAAHRLKPGPYAVAPSEPEAAQQAALAILNRRPGVTAVIGANFWLTVGALRAAPDDLVVVGFDDLVLTDLLRRPVTTIVQPAADLGRHAVQLLIEEIATPGNPRHIVLPPRLIARPD